MKNKILLVLGILLGLMMLNSGLNKFFGFMEMPPLPEDAGSLMMAFAGSGWMIPLIALAEIVGGILFAIPKTRALGAIVLFPIILGILLFHILQAPDGLIMSIILFVINIVVIIDNKEKYLPMISK
ncbi:DoxX family membrane protein [Crocinitomix catalasitica]|uniref:DoxX family membrane protein n=1 Tax=Crocinitomix catalasitica TaxID=184607 RepID=UPI000480BF1E|nr:DoxX family membrane protein [Crocinitomix catalasitica]